MKVIALVVAAVLLSSDGVAEKVQLSDNILRATSGNGSMSSSAEGIAELLSAARGAPPLICSYASQSVRNGGWGWSDAPVTPLGNVGARRNERLDSDLSEADINLLLESLSSDDPCVRELSVRLVSRRSVPRVAPELVTRLASPLAPLREIAALGLGMIESSVGVEPLMRALRDATPGVRANSAWALGQAEDGRALSSLMSVFGDGSPVVREAAVIAVGKIDSTRSAARIIRVLATDDSPAVRRAAAWALGEMEADEGVESLAHALARDVDTRVREMSAWALGTIESRSGVAALIAAARRDADDKVRETAVWALAEIEDEGSADALDAVISGDRSTRVRGTAAWAIGQIREGSGRAPAGLVRLLKDESADTRVKAAWALGQIGDSTALPAIRDALKRETDQRVTSALTRALLESGERSTATFSQLLESSDPKVREAAVRALAGRSSMNPWPWPQPRPRPNP